MLNQANLNRLYVAIASAVALCLVIVALNVATSIRRSSEPLAESGNSKVLVLKEMASLGVLADGYAEWFVSPNGSKSGKGTERSPINISTALSGDFPGIKPGDIIWLRGGTYVGLQTSRVQGSPKLPIHIRQYPGERAIFDKGLNRRESGTIDVRGDNVWFWDFEVANSFPERGRLDPDGEMNPNRGSGINIYGSNTKYINLIVRDNGHGFGLWNETGGTEIYGCLIFNNGNNKKEHGVYGHNKTGSHLIRDNVIFNNAGYGLHLYANSTKSSVSGFDIAGNTIFKNGALMMDDQVADQILVGGVQGVPAERITLTANNVFNDPSSPTSKNRGIRLGYEDTSNKDVKLIGNYIVSKVPLRLLWWQTVEARGNTIVSAGRSVDITDPPQSTKYIWESNKYLSPANKPAGFLMNDVKLTLANWQSDKGFDRQSQQSNSEAENAVILKPNKYERGRAIVTVFNWKKLSTVKANLKSILLAGDRYEIWDVQNLFAKPLTTGVFDGNQIEIAMNSREIAAPVGKVERIPVHTGVEFGAFLVKKIKTGDGQAASR